MPNEVKGKYKDSLVVSFASMDDLLKFMEKIKRKDNELGIVEAKWIERRALDKADYLVKRKDEKHREKNILLAKDEAFLSIMEKFSNKEKDVFTEGGVRQ